MLIQHFGWPWNRKRPSKIVYKRIWRRPRCSDIREKLEAFCIRHILFKQRVPRKAWRTDLPGVLSTDALLLALWRGNSAWALYYLQDQSKRGLRYTHYFYGEVDFYETTVPAEWLDELIGELRTIVIPVWSKSDWMTTSMSLQGSGFCYRYGKQTVRFSWDQVPDEWAPLEQWVLETSQELDAQFSSPAKEADEK